MTDFPTRENDIAQLANRMEYGYQWNAADFPHNGRIKIMFAKFVYINAVRSADTASALAVIATVAKDRSLEELVSCMKGLLKKAEADIAGDPVKLAWIGWGPKAEPRPLEAPGEPRGLVIADWQGRTIDLAWQRPLTGGAVRNYIVEGKTASGASGMDQWRFIASVYETEAYLHIPEEVSEIELRVVAGNPAGKSSPSNSVTVAFEPAAV